MVVLLLLESGPQYKPPVLTYNTYFTESEAKELPSVSTIRECRTVIQTLNDFLVAYKLANQDKWHQVFTDGITHSQISFQCLIIDFLTAFGFWVVVALPRISLVDDTSEGQVDNIWNKIKKTKELYAAGLPMSYKLGPRWDDVITWFDFKSEAIFGFLSPNYTGQCT